MEVELPDDLLSTQLSLKLNDEDVSLEERLQTAKLVFLSSTIGIHNKEELVFKWLAGILKKKENDTATHALQLLSTFFSDQRMIEFRGEIKPSVSEELFNALNCVFEWGEPAVIEHGRACILQTLSLNYFQVWFAREPKDMILLAKNFYASLSDDTHMEDASRVLKMISSVQKQCVLKQELRRVFIEQFLPALIAYFGQFVPRVLMAREFEVLVSSSFSQVIFYEPKFLVTFIKMTNESKTEREEDCQLLIDSLKGCLKDEYMKGVAYTFRALLRLPINRREEEHPLILELFSGLCKIMGIDVHRMFSVNVSPVEGWSSQSSFHVITSIVNLFEKSNVSFNIELEGVSLQNWLTTLIISLVNINTGSLSPELLKMVKYIYAFNPLTIEPSLKPLVSIILQKKPSSLVLPYEQMMLSVFEGSSKLQRFQKVVSKLLPILFDQLMFLCNEELVLDDAFPQEVSDNFGEFTSLLPHTQALATLKMLTYHFETSFLNKYRAGQSDIEVILAGEITACLLSSFLETTELTYQTVPDVCQNKLELMLQDLSDLLENWAQAIIVYEHNDRISASFFKLCSAYGKIMYYINFHIHRNLRSIVLSDLVPTNLHYVFPFLTPDDWERIAQKVANHTDCQARRAFFDLLVLKVVCIRGAEEGREVPSVRVAQYLIEMADKEWLWKNISNFSALLEPLEMVRFMCDMVDFAGDDQGDWTPIIFSEYFMENKSLDLSLGYALFNKMSSVFPENEGNFISRRVLSVLDPVKLIEFELSLTFTDESEEAEDVETSLLAMNEIIESSLLEPTATVGSSPDSSFFPVISALPFQYFSAQTISATIHSLLALLHDLPPNEQNDTHLFDMLGHLIQKDVSPMGSANPGTVFMFLGQRGKGFEGLKPLLQRVCRNAFMHKKTAKQLMKGVSRPTSETLWLTVLAIQALIVVKNKAVFFSGNGPRTEANERKLNKKECIQKLIDIVLPFLLEAEPSVENIDEFATILKHVITTSNSNARHIVSKVPAYIDVSLSDYEKSSDFVETVLANRAHLFSVIPSNYIDQLWRCAFEDDACLKAPLVKKAALYSTPEEFLRMLSFLQSETEACLKENRPDDSHFGTKVTLRFLAWRMLLEEQLSSEKAKARHNAVVSLSDPLLKSISTWSATSSSVKDIFDTLALLPQMASFDMRPVMVDVMFEALANVPLPQENPNKMLLNFEAAIDCLFSLYLFKNTMIVDRIPLVLQFYRHFLNTMAIGASAVPENNSSLTYTFNQAAEKLEKFARTIVKRKKDFARIGSYVVADVIAIFEKHTLNGTFKMHYTNIFNAFMTLCDAHGINYLKMSLPTNHQELFKTMLEDYNAHHKYTGKI